MHKGWFIPKWQCNNHHPGLSALNLKVVKPFDGIEIVSLIGNFFEAEVLTARLRVIFSASATDIGFISGF